MLNLFILLVDWHEKQHSDPTQRSTVFISIVGNSIISVLFSFSGIDPTNSATEEAPSRPASGTQKRRCLGSPVHGSSATVGDWRKDGKYAG